MLLGLRLRMMQTNMISTTHARIFEEKEGAKEFAVHWTRRGLHKTSEDRRMHEQTLLVLPKECLKPRTVSERETHCISRLCLAISHAVAAYRYCS